MSVQQVLAAENTFDHVAGPGFMLSTAHDDNRGHNDLPNKSYSQYAEHGEEFAYCPSPAPAFYLPIVPIFAHEENEFLQICLFRFCILSHWG